MSFRGRDARVGLSFLLLLSLLCVLERESGGSNAELANCCFSLCVKKGGMFEKKTLSLSIFLYSLYTDQSQSE